MGDYSIVVVHEPKILEAVELLRGEIDVADEEHLAEFKKGSESWNRWRDENFAIQPDLSKLNFKSAILHGFNFSNADLSHAQFFKATLGDINFSGASLFKAKLLATILINSNLSSANLNSASLTASIIIEDNFSGADLSCAHVEASTFINANFNSADLNDAFLEFSVFIKSTFDRTNLSNSSLNASTFISANFNRANFSGAFLESFQAPSADFTSAILTGVCLTNWNIGGETNLDNVTCDYVYMEREGLDRCPSERRPSDPSKKFAHGEFALLFQKALTTVDLIFADGIDWKAFFQSFQECDRSTAMKTLLSKRSKRKVAMLSLSD